MSHEGVPRSARRLRWAPCDALTLVLGQPKARGSSDMEEKRKAGNRWGQIRADGKG